MKIKYKHIIIIAILAGLSNLFGAMFKILHWAFPIGEDYYFGGEELLIISIIFMVTAVVLLIIKLMTSKRHGALK
jgi:hypothetical protein